MQPGVNVAKADVTKNDWLAAKFRTEKLPTLYMKNGDKYIKYEDSYDNFPLLVDFIYKNSRLNVQETNCELLKQYKDSHD